MAKILQKICFQKNNNTGSHTLSLSLSRTHKSCVRHAYMKVKPVTPITCIFFPFSVDKKLNSKLCLFFLYIIDIYSFINAQNLNFCLNCLKSWFEE